MFSDKGLSSVSNLCSRRASNLSLKPSGGKSVLVVASLSLLDILRVQKCVQVGPSSARFDNFVLGAFPGQSCPVSVS